MPVPVFSVNEVLTSSAMNQVGLWKVKEQTVGSGVANVTVSNAFNSNFDAYKILYTGGSSTANGAISFALNGSPVGWYGNLVYANFASGAPASAGYLNTTSLVHAGSIAGLMPQLLVDVQNPFLAKPTYCSGSFVDATNAGHVVGIHSDSISYSGFVIAHMSGGTFTGGTITVYGYRKA